MTGSLFTGMWLGFCIAAPVGPIGTLVLKESITRGALAGLACGLGAAIADLMYGALAVAGVRMVSGYERPAALIGGAFLLWLAWRSWREQPAVETVREVRGSKQGLARNVVVTFLLTASNPMTIVSFAAMVASAGSAAPVYFVVGVFGGSMIWWVILSGAASRLAGLIRGAVLNRVTAVTLGGFGIWAIWAKGIA